MAGNSPTVLVTCHHLLKQMSSYTELFNTNDIGLMLPEAVGQQFTEDDMAKFFKDCDVAICGDDPMPRRVIEAGSNNRLKTIIRWGVGTDSVDKVAAKELGIKVLNTPNVFGEEVADAAFALILMLARGYHLMNQSVVDGGWLKIIGRSLNGLTLGVVGMGSIGQATLRRAHGFGMTTIGYDPVEIDTATMSALNAEQLPLDDVISQSDILVLCCNLTPENYHLMNADTLRSMKSDSYLVNVARGPLVDNTALFNALQDGPLAAAALDVMEIEPFPLDDPLRKLDNCIYGTHNGSNTREAVKRVNDRTVSMALAELGIEAG